MAVLDTISPHPSRLMGVVGAFVDLRIGGLAIEIMSDLTDVRLYDIGSSPEEVIELCAQHPTDVILVSGDFFPHVETVRANLAKRGLPSPLWIAFIGPPRVYSHEKANALDIHVGVHVDDFTHERWHTAVSAADRYSRCNKKPLRVVTATSTDLPRKTLASLLGPCGFRFGSNFQTHRDLLTGVLTQQPDLVLFGHSMITEVGEVRQALRSCNIIEPRWVLMLAHVDPLTLITAATIGVKHMFTSDQLEPVEGLATLLRSFVESDSCAESPLSRVDAILSVARDDDDRAILRLLTTGAKNDVIAARIFASEQTVKNRLSRMMKVVGVSNRTEFALLLTGTKMPPPRHFSLTDDIPAPRLLPSPSDTASPSDTVLPSPGR